MDIFERLKADHDRHRTMLDRIEQTTDVGERKTLFEQFQVEIRAHAAAEEQSLYATMLADPDLNHDGKHSVAEHKEIEDTLGELYQGDMASPDWCKGFGALKHRYLHHIDEEEDEIFPHADQDLSATVKDRLAARFAARKPVEKDRARAEPPGDDRE